MKNALLVLASLLIPPPLYSQNIKGRFVDETNKQPIDGGFVTLLSFPKKEFIASTYTGADGNFHIKGSANDSTALVLSALGYKDSLIVVPPLKEDLTIGEISLALNKEIVLDEVLVTAKPYELRKDVDRIVMSLTKLSELTRNNTIWGMLRYTPMLKVDEVQGLSMLGKENLVVYINGRKTTMSATEVQSYLKSVPAENIKTIELITNPGSKFNVPAHTGIVNITLRRNEGEGLKGFVSAYTWQTHYNKQFGSLNLNYVKGKFDLKTVLSARNISDWRESENEVLFPKSGLTTERSSVSENRRQLYSGNFDLAFRPDERQTLGVVVNFGGSNAKPKDDATSTYSKRDQETPDSVLYSYLHAHTKTNRVATNLNYTFNINPNNSLLVDFDYQYYKLKKKEDYNSSVLEDYTGSNGKDESSYAQTMPQTNHLWMEQIEYAAKLRNGHKITIGSNGYISDTKNENDYTELHNLSERYYPDTRFDYNEKGISGYLSYEARWNDKISSSVDAKVEYINAKGELLIPDNETFSRDYLSFLPSLSLNYSPSNRHYLWYSLASSNELPMYEYLNPFKNYQSSTVYSTGNINLKPSYTLYHEIGYYLNSQYLFTLSQYTTRDDWEVFTLADGNVEVSMPVNYGKKKVWRLAANINHSFFNNRWFLNATLMGEYTRYKGGYANINIDQDWFSGDVNLNNTVVLSKKHSWNLLTNYQYRTPRKVLFRKIESDMRVSVEIRKNIKQWALSASYFRAWTYNGSNYSSVGRGSYITPDMERRSFSKGEYQGFMLKASCSFGNKKVKSGKKHQMVSGGQTNRYSGNM